MKRTVVTEFEVLRFCRSLRCAIINCVSDGSTPKAVIASPSGAFPPSPVFPPTVTTGMVWMRDDTDVDDWSSCQ